MKVTRSILEEIKKFDTIIIHRHVRPDPDAIGSQCGLKEILKTTYPKKNIFAVGSESPSLTFLAPMDQVPDSFYTDALVIVVDTANTERVSDNRFEKARKIIKIDHHPNDEHYGDLSWVDDTASSASEMIASLWLQYPDTLTLNDAGARLLYAGIVGDTGRFLYPATTVKTLTIAAKLRQFNFNASDLSRELSSIPLKVAQLFGYVYQNLNIDVNGAAYVLLSNKLLRSYGLEDSDTAPMVSLAGQIKDIESWAVFVEQNDGDYRVRLRSKKIPINSIAKKHHGGGHLLASGAKAKDLKEVNQIYRELQKLVENG